MGMRLRAGNTGRSGGAGVDCVLRDFTVRDYAGSGGPGGMRDDSASFSEQGWSAI